MSRFQLSRDPSRDPSRQTAPPMSHPRPSVNVIARRGLAVAAAIASLALLQAVAPIGVAARPAALATGCDWARRADRLDGRLLLTYHADATDADGGALSQHHDADVRLQLRLLARNAEAVVYSGPLAEGWAAVHDRWQAADSSPVQQLQGHGAPATGPALAGSVATVRVDLRHCTLQMAARLAVLATDDGGPTQPQTVGWLALVTPLSRLVPTARGAVSADLALPVQPMQGGRVDAGSAARHGDAGSAAERAAALGTAYLPVGVLASALPSVQPPAGQAQLRLALAPVR